MLFFGFSILVLRLLTDQTFQFCIGWSSPLSRLSPPFTIPPFLEPRRPQASTGRQVGGALYSFSSFEVSARFPARFTTSDQSLKGNGDKWRRRRREKREQDRNRRSRTIRGLTKFWLILARWSNQSSILSRLLSTYQETLSLISNVYSFHPITAREIQRDIESFRD